ncbi:MAG: sulfur transferase domain-containing protein [Pseudomonadota bacterium]
MKHWRKLAFVLAVSLGLAAWAGADDVISAGQPDEATVEQYAAAGYKTVIDLRTAGEDRGMDEPAVVAAAGMKYVSLPVSRSDITFEKAKQLDALLGSEEGPVVLHCGSGNRVGALMALRASLKGKSDDEALQVGREFGLTGLAERVEAVLEKAD